jgi:demethylmenaquinone methyltransferase/2-methoxy-6-polyprenyl-1,4-benzoquinol methylase
MSKDAQTASFGFRTVDPSQKARLVKGVFSSVASRYDLMNDLMSAGIHRIWKSAFVTRLNPQVDERLIDVAGGTGDIAREFLRRAAARPLAGARAPASAVICDINEDMVAAGIQRGDCDGALERVCGDAEALPFAERSFSACSIAFGIRNVTNIDAALNEALRVLKPGGRFYCLEFSHPITDGLQKIYDAYSFNVIPWLGEIVAKDRESYRYLVESIRRFPSQTAFAAMIERAGFSRVKFENLTGGVAAIHSGWRL